MKNFKKPFFLWCKKEKKYVLAIATLESMASGKWQAASAHLPLLPGTSVTPGTPQSHF